MAVWEVNRQRRGEASINNFITPQRPALVLPGRTPQLLTAESNEDIEQFQQLNHNMYSANLQDKDDMDI
jgi:hypothetical protein